MDFKVTGTKDGITATQMDIKVDGLSYEILERALNQAKEGRMHILNKITETIAEPRAELKEHAPRIETMTIPKEFIGAVDVYKRQLLSWSPDSHRRWRLFRQRWKAAMRSLPMNIDAYKGLETYPDHHRYGCSSSVAKQWNGC